MDFNLPSHGLVLSFARNHPEEFAQVLQSCTVEEAYQLLDALPILVLIKVVAFAPRRWASQYIESRPVSEISKWIQRGSIDTVTRLARRMPETLRKEVLTNTTDPKKKRAIQQYVNFARHTVAALADKDFLWFRDTTNCAEVILQLREVDLATSENVLIIDEREKVLGLLNENKLLRSGNHEPIKSCVLHTTLLPASSPLHAVLELNDWHYVDRLPVIDRNRHAIGILKWAQLVEQEATFKAAINDEPQHLILEIMNTLLNAAKEITISGGSKGNPQ